MIREHREDVIKLSLSAVLFAAALIIPSEGPLRLAVFAIPYLIAGYEVLWSAVRSIFKGEIFDENFLMALASIGAFCIGEYPEAVAVMLFYGVGELFEHIAVGKSRKSIAALMDIRPDYAVVLRSGTEEKVSPAQVNVGETVIVRPFEKIPLDGTIIEGETSVNAAALTGESLPVDKKTGDAVMSGSINLGGMIKVVVKSPYSESTVAKILELVENASSKKARQENFITRFARYYTPCVVVGAALLAFVPPIFFSGDISEWVRRALIFLVVSCPCALVVSVPLSFFGGIGGASLRGILIKGSNYLEALSRVKTVVFDITGTLTAGSFKVVAVHPELVSPDELLEIAAAAESFSNHPIAESIVSAHGKDIDKSRFGEVSELPGRGIKAVIDKKTVWVGNCTLMEEAGSDWHECELSGTAVHISIDGKYMGHIIISDELKSDAKNAISALSETGVKRIALLTGDMKKVGESVAHELSIDEVYSELLPAGKVEKVEELLSEKIAGSTLAFVGDGINDAPVLSRADIGIAMGALGSDAAIEAADIVLMDDKPSKIVTALA
ncbi:MAG: cadmium-translocating P-type ATPase, partial [Clostridiales bacterium]|nr:cadmium-translocating P-type ATPase [Clostridiales bacterium]